jgi:hypothetical protein
MAVRANIQASYRWRMLFVTVFCVAFAGWFLYDGAIGYPAQAVRAKKYQKMQESGHDGWEEEWEDLAKEKGWPTADPGDPKKVEDFQVQFIFVGIMAVFAIPFFYIFLSTRGRWIEMDDDGFNTSWKQRCKFDDISGFDKRKWYNKGIAKILYEEGGKQRKLTLDDCKYDREPTEMFVREVSLDLDEDQIIGGRGEEFADEESDTEQDAAPESEAAEVTEEEK